MSDRRHALWAAVSIALAACGTAGPHGSAPVDATRSTLVAAPAQAVADGASTVTLTATARDASGAPLSGRRAAFTVGGTANLLSAAEATTGADGTARVTMASTRAESKEVSVAVDGQRIGAPVVVTFTPGPPALAAVSVSAAPARVVAGGAASTLSVTVVDGHGNPVPGVAVTLSSSGTGDLLVPPAAPTDAAGVATGTLSSTRAGSKVVTAWIDGVAAPATAAVDVVAGAPALASSRVTGPAAPVVADGAASARFLAAVADAWGNPVAGTTVTFSTTAGQLSAGSAVTGADGTATVALISTSAGVATLTASVGGLSLGTADATFVAGAAASLVFAAQPASGTAGAALPAITVEARDVYGNSAALPGPVTLSLATEGALAGATLAPTGSAVTLTGLSVFKAGSYTLQATSGALQVDGASFVVGPAAPVSLALTGLPAAATAGDLPPITVTALDTYGNVASGYRGTVRITASDSAASLPAGYTFTAADAGVHTFSGLSLRTAGAQRVAVTDAANATLAAAQSVTVSPAAASALAFDRQPSNAVAGSILGPAVRVLLLDAYGNLATGGTEAVTLSLSGGPAGATLLGARIVPSLGGVAEFLDLSVQSAGTAYALVAASGALAGATSRPFDVVAAPADPATSGVDAATAPLPAGDTVALTATVRDCFGNPVAGEAVTFGATGSGNTLTAPAGATGADGRAAGALSSIRAGRKVVTGFLSGARAMAGTATVNVVPGAPAPGAASSLVATPASVPDDGTWAALAATVKDRYGNAVAGARVVFSGDASTTFDAPAPLTDPDGVATGRVSSLVAGTPIVTASIDATAVASVSVTFTAAPPSATRSTVTVSSDSVAADGVTAATVTVTVVDTIGRPMAGQTVQLAYGGSATPAPASVTTDGSGLARFTLVSAAPTSGALPAIVNPGPDQVALASTPALTFVPAYRLGGTVSGLLGSGLVLASPGLPDVTVNSGATGFTFAAGLPSGAAYAVTVVSQPVDPEQTCAVAGGAATVSRGDVMTVAVTCRPNWKVVAAGYAHTVAVKTDGTLWAWGYNVVGQLGDGTTTDAHAPVQIGSGFAFVAASGEHTLGVKADGTLWAWGDNTRGQLGDGTTTEAHDPVQVGTGFVSVAAGPYHTVALKSDGSLWAWGFDECWQLGDGTSKNTSTPIFIGAGFASVAAGTNHTVALKSDATLWAWGCNASGALGNRSVSGESAPVQVDSGFVSVAAGGDHTLGVKTDGTLWAWGNNGSGQLGNGTTTDAYVPVQVGSGFASVTTGAFHTLALKTDGTLWAWGYNAGGQLGNGTTTEAHAPVQVGAGFASVAAGAAHTVAVKRDGTLWTWGDNTYGPLGDGGGDRTVPSQIP